MGKLKAALDVLPGSDSLDDANGGSTAADVEGLHSSCSADRFVPK